MIVHQSALRPSMAIYKVVTSYIGQHAQNHWVRGLKMNWIVTVQEAATGSLHAHLPCKAANSRYIDICNYSPIRLPNIQHQILLWLHWRSMTRWGTERVGSQYWDYIWQWLIHFSLTRLTGPIIVDSPLMLSLPWAYPQYGTIHFGIVYR
jgi:hypothetical protein